MIEHVFKYSYNFTVEECAFMNAATNNWGHERPLSTTAATSMSKFHEPPLSTATATWMSGLSNACDQGAISDMTTLLCMNLLESPVFLACLLAWNHLEKSTKKGRKRLQHEPVYKCSVLWSALPQFFTKGCTCQCCATTFRLCIMLHTHAMLPRHDMALWTLQIECSMRILAYMYNLAQS